MMKALVYGGPRFALGDIIKAYGTFGNAAQERALKVILTNPVGK